MFGSMSYFELSRRTFSFALGLLLLLTSADQSNGDIVPISTSDAVGTGNRDSNSNFIGILDSAIPTTVTSLSVNTPGAPATEVFAIGDVVGRDVGAAGGDRTWEYVLDLPINAAPGTGLSDISFSAHAFERPINNLEGDDELVWELFLNGNAVAVDSGTTGAGVDFNSIDINLSDPGSASTNEALVRLTVNGFNAGNEWFAARGTLSANFETIPEPSGGMLLVIASIGLVQRRRRQVQQR